MTRPESGFRYIGQPMPRHEDARLIAGQGRFTDDFGFPGQAYAAMVRSPHPHARIVSIDKSRVLALPGVLGVFTGADCVADGLGPIQHDPLPKTRDDMKLSRPGGGEVFIGPHLLLPADKVRHVGEAVAMVVAETRAQALDAAEALPVVYDELPFVLHSEDAMLPGAATVWDEVPGNILVDTRFGDHAGTERAFAQAANVVAMDFNIGRVTGVPIEPRACVANYDAATGRYTLHAGSGGAVRQKRELAERAEYRARHVARAVVRRRRQFRHPQPRLSGIRPGAVGVAQARPPGQIHRLALGMLHQRLPGPRSGDETRTGARRQRPLPGATRDQYQQCRRALRLALAAEQRRRADHRQLRHSGRLAARGFGLHQHDPDAGLSQLRPPGGDLCDRTIDRHRRREARYRPRQPAPPQSGAAKSDALPQRRRHDL